MSTKSPAGKARSNLAVCKWIELRPRPASAVRETDRARLASGNLMALFWLVHEIDGARVVRIQEGGALIFARLNAMIDGFGGTFVEAHALDAKLG